MKVLVTGSAGHLGEALVRQLRADGQAVQGLDLLATPFTDVVGSITDAALVARCMAGVDVVLHTATLHKPHMATHPMADFVATNVQGTLTLLEAAVAAGVGAFVCTSTTSAFGAALAPAPGQPAAWIDEAVVPVPRNIYGATKLAAEDLCQVVQRRHGLPCVVLRTSRFFAEADDSADRRAAQADAHTKLDEFTHRRVDLEDAVSAHLLAAQRAPALGFARCIVSATTPFTRDDLAALRVDAHAVLARRAPEAAALYQQLGLQHASGIDRVYDNSAARALLGWQPRHDVRSAAQGLATRGDWRSALHLAVGRKSYHPGRSFSDGPFPVD